MTLLALILTKNEEKNIKRCLRELDIIDEIIVVNDYSTDNTIEIAKNLGAKVYKRKLDGDFASQKNYGLSKCHGEWILSIDADEIVSDELKKEIIKVVSDKSSSVNGYYLKRVDILWGKKMKYSEFGNKLLLRLAKKGAGKWKRRVHESWDIKGETKALKSELLHYPHKNLSEFVGNVNLFSQLHAKANDEEYKSSNLLKILLWPSGKFIYNFVMKKGIFDGERAFIASMMMSFHSFLSWSSLWLLQKRRDNK